MKRLTFILLLFATSALATSYTEFYVQPTGSNLNSGHTPDDTATFTAASGYWTNATGIFYKADLNPESTVSNGAWAALSYDGGTTNLFVGLVTARSDADDTITISLTAKGGTAPADNLYGTNTIRVGGAWKGPNNDIAYTGASDPRMMLPFGFVVNTMTNTAGNVTRVNFKGTFEVTNAMTHLLAGPVVFEGYGVTPGDNLRAIIDGKTSTAGYVVMTTSGANNVWKSLLFTNNGSSGTSILLDNGNGGENLFYNCVFTGSRGTGLQTGLSMVVGCEAYENGKGNGTASGFSDGGETHYAFCFSHHNSGTTSRGFSLNANTVLTYSISASNAWHGVTSAAGENISLINVVCFGNKGAGYDINETAGTELIMNCAFFANSGAAITNSIISPNSVTLINNVFGSGTYANAGGDVASTLIGTRRGVTETGTITYPADTTPWVDPAAMNFNLQSDATIRAAGFGTFSTYSTNNLNTMSYPDIGAVQGASTNAGATSIIRRAIFTQ